MRPGLNLSEKPVKSTSQMALSTSTTARWEALTAIDRSILVIIFHMLADPTVEFGADHYTQRLDRARRTNQLTRQLQALGYTVTLTTAA